MTRECLFKNLYSQRVVRKFNQLTGSLLEDIRGKDFL